jgi:hypothetical protein
LRFAGVSNSVATAAVTLISSRNRTTATMIVVRRESRIVLPTTLAA